MNLLITHILQLVCTSAALECAKASDYIVLTVSNAGSEGGGEGSDRDTIGLDEEQANLVCTSASIFVL